MPDDAVQRAARTIIFVPGLSRSSANTGEAVVASIRAAADLQGARLSVRTAAPAPEGLRAVGAIVDSGATAVVDIYELDYRRSFEQLDRDDAGREDAPPGVLTAVYSAVRVCVLWGRAFFRGGATEPTKSVKARVQLAVGLLLALLFVVIAVLVVATAVAAVVRYFAPQVTLPVLVDPEAVLWGGLAATTVYVVARRALLRVATVTRRVLRYYDEAGVRERLATEVERSVDDLLDEGYSGEIHLLAYSFGCSVVLDAVLRPVGEAAQHCRVGKRLSSLVTVGCPYDAERRFFPDRLRDRESITPSLRWRNVFVASDLFGSNFAVRDDTVAGRRDGPGGLEVCSIRYLPDEQLDFFSLFRLAAFRNHTGYWHDMCGCWSSVLDLWGLAPACASDRVPPDPVLNGGNSGMEAPIPASGPDGSLRRTIVFLLALAALLTAARGGVDLRVITALFVAYVIAAAVWVRGQYERSLHGDPWLPRGRWLAAAAGVAVGLLVVYLLVPADWNHRGAVLLALLVVAYVFGGYLVVRWRCKAARRFRQLPAEKRSRVGALLWPSIGGVVCLVGGVVLVVLGLTLLGRASPAVAGTSLAAGLLLFFFPAVSVTSEAPIAWLSERTGAARLAWLLGGALLFTVVAAGALLAAGSPLVLVPFVAVALLVVALASSTQADIAAVLAVLAFMGITPMQWGIPNALRPAGHDEVLVALGDSYMSGEGASSYYENTDEGGGNACRRAPTSWAAMAGQQRPFDSMFFVACSGAGTRNVRDDQLEPAPVAQPGEDGTQLAQYARRSGEFTPALVVVSLGGNDAGFSTIGQMCLAPGNCADAQDLWLGGLAEVGASLTTTYAEIRKAFPVTPVVVVPYPDPIDERGGGCDQIALTVREQEFIQTFLGRLNEIIEAVAAKQRFYYLGEMQNALADSDLQLCDALNQGRPGVNFVGLRSVNGDPDQRFNPANWLHNSLHPNERGHTAMLRVFQNWLAGRDSLARIALPVEASVTGAAQAGGQPGAASAGCSVYDTTSEGCRPRGTAWALRQTGQQGLIAGGLMLLAMAGVWAASVAFFAWRRTISASPADQAAP